jgi:hypothetical protein
VRFSGLWCSVWYLPRNRAKLIRGPRRENIYLNTVQ